MTQSRKLNARHSKWIMLLILGLVVYGLAQPWANRKFDWNLPSLATLWDSESPHSNKDARNPEASANRSDRMDEPTAQTAEAKGAQKPDLRSQSSPAADTGPVQQAEPTRGGSAQESKQSSTSTQSLPSTPEQLVHGLLREIRRDEYLSPAGLRYTRGSEEGHRLKHLAKHLEDEPGRPGRHGVFTGDMPQVLVWLDEAYRRAKSGAKGTRKREERGRLIYEVNFDKPVGFIGGRDGNRAGNPLSKRLRMVVDGDRLITAFPF